MTGRRLSGQRVLVTGGASGIGFALADALADLIAAPGAELILLGRTTETLHKAIATLKGKHSGLAISSLVIDLAQRPFPVAELADLADVDLLIHSAGSYVADPLLEVDAATLDRLFQVNVSGALELTRVAAPGLVRRGGQIVFIGSSVVTQPVRATPGAYTVTKRAASAMADALRDSLNSEGVRVLTVHPGRTATPMQEALSARENQDWQPERLLQPEDVAQAVISAVQLPATAELTELSIRPFQKN